MQLLNKHGLPVGITFRKNRQGLSSYVFRVALSLGKTTDIGADPNALAESFKRAVDRRIDALDYDVPATERKRLYGSLDAFKRHYGIELETVSGLRFKIKEE